MVKFERYPGLFDALASDDIDDVIDSLLFKVVCANGRFFHIMKKKYKVA